MVMRQLMSVEDYLALPEEKPYLEYVNGEVCAKPMPDWIHYLLVDELAAALREYRKVHGGYSGPEGRVAFSDDRDVRVYLPDLSYYDASIDPRRRPMPPPTLAIEVRSEGQSLSWLREKCRYFRAHGTDAAWLVDPFRRVVEVFEGDRDGDALDATATIVSAALPGFELAIRDLFAVIDD